jgi:hypothetical protein
MLVCKEPGLHVIYGARQSGKSTLVKCILYQLQRTNELKGPLYRTLLDPNEDRDHYTKCFGALDFKQFDYQSRDMTQMITIIADEPVMYGLNVPFQTLIPHAKTNKYRLFLVVEFSQIQNKWQQWSKFWFGMPHNYYAPLQPYSIQSTPFLLETLRHEIPDMIKPLIDLILTYVLFAPHCLDCVKHL